VLRSLKQTQTPGIDHRISLSTSSKSELELQRNDHGTASFALTRENNSDNFETFGFRDLGA
jgi:hypothetical protein